jgi:hypothetical protein
MLLGHACVASCLALALFVPVESAALRTQQSGRDPQPIEWTSDRKLGWRDFTTKVPARTTTDSHSWVGFNTSWSCEGGEFAFRVKTMFDPLRSWVRPGSQDAALLRHEQTHFDLTELAARQLRKQLTEMIDPCGNFMALREVDRIIADQNDTWEREQKRYDRETDHGTDENRQKFWDRRTREQLDELRSFQ